MLSPSKKANSSKTKRELIEDLERIETLLNAHLYEDTGQPGDGPIQGAGPSFGDFAEFTGSRFFECNSELRVTYASAQPSATSVQIPVPSHQDSLNRFFAQCLPARAPGFGVESVPILSVLDARKAFRDFRFQMPGQDSEVFSASGTPFLDENGNFHGYRGCVNLDVRKSAPDGLPGTDQGLLNDLEAFPFAIAKFGPDEKLVACNEKFRSLLSLPPGLLAPGIPFEQIIRSSLDEGQFVDAAGREEEFLRERMQAHRNPGQPALCHFRKNQWLEIREEKAADGGTICIAMDITAIHQSREDLQYHKRMMEAVLDAMPSAVWVKNQEGRYLLVNKALAETYNRSPAQFLGKTAIEVGHLTEQDRRWFAELDAGVFSSGQEQEIPERRVTLPNNEYRIRHTAKIPLRDANGKIEAILGVSRDITERKRAEAELRHSHQLMAGILEIADDAIISVDEGQIITMYNKGAERIFGFAAGEAIGQHLDMLLPEPVRRAHKHHMDIFSDAAHASRSMSERAEVFGQRKSGERFPAEASISKLDLGGSKIYTVMLRDVTQRKQVEESLRSSRRLLQTVFNTIPHPILVKDGEGRYLMINAAASEHYGLPPEEILNKAADELTHRRAEDIRSVMEADARVLRTGDIVTEQVSRLRHDGREVDLQSIRAPLRDDDGAVVGLVLVAVDITERVQAEQRAKEAHERLVDAVESISHGFVLYDPQDKLVLWNERFAEINEDIKELLVPGTPFETIVRKAATRGRAAQSGGSREKWIQERLDSHNNPKGSVERQESNGNWYLAAERRTREGGTAGVWTEITKRKRIEEALRAREEQLQLFITHAPVAVAMFDRDMRYMVHSRRWVEDFELEKNELIGLSHYDVFPETPQHWMEAYERCLEGSVEVCAEDSIQRADGSLWWLRWEIHPWRNAKGEINGIVAFIELINDRKKTEAQLIRSQRMEAVGQLTGGVAHEFNNLLHIIRSYAFLLGERSADSPETLALIRPIENASTRGRDLVKRLLSFSRRQLLQPQVMDLGEVALDLIELIRRPLGETIELVTVTSDKLWPILVDRGELENALINLALNARDAMPKGGKLTITTQNFTAPEPALSGGAGHAPREYVRLAVSDAGSGIPPDIQEHVFEPFFTTKGMAEHSGLGLSMVHGFVNQSGGYVSIDSAPDQGTTVSLYLPRVVE